MQPRAINISLVSFPIKHETVAVYGSERVQPKEPGAWSPSGQEETESRKNMLGKESLHQDLPSAHSLFPNCLPALWVHHPCCSPSSSCASVDLMAAPASTSITLCAKHLRAQSGTRATIKGDWTTLCAASLTQRVI